MNSDFIYIFVNMINQELSLNKTVPCEGGELSMDL